MSQEEIKKQIHQRLEGFDVGMVQTDVDSWIFDNKTMLKIEELSKEFDMSLVVEVFNTIYLQGSEKVYPFNTSSMCINGIQAKRILGTFIKYQDQQYESKKSLGLKEVEELSKEMVSLFDDLVIPDSDTDKRFVKDPDEWIKRVHEMKEKYGMHGFHLMYDTIERIRSLMRTEGLDEMTATTEVANRQEKEMEILLAERARRANQVKGSLAHYQSQIESTMEECLTTPYFEPTTEQQSFMMRSLMHGMAGALSLGSSMVTTYQGSGGHGYDISTNGGRHKKVVTGKAGNRYPVAKRRGVR